VYEGAIAIERYSKSVLHSAEVCYQSAVQYRTARSAFAAIAKVIVLSLHRAAVVPQIAVLLRTTALTVVLIVYNNRTNSNNHSSNSRISTRCLLLAEYLQLSLQSFLNSMLIIVLVLLVLLKSLMTVMRVTGM
jgi:hypothetical protein